MRRVQATIESKLPRGLYRARTEDGRLLTVSPTTQAKRALVALVPGDSVIVEIAAHDPTRGLIQSRTE